MKNTILWSLVALNVFLLALFISGLRENRAMAQARAGGRPSDYLMIPGDVSGGTVGVVYILDVQNSLLSAMAYEDANKRLDFMPSLDLARVLETGLGKGARSR